MIDVIAEARTILRAACGDRVRDDVSMAPLTTFRIGGRASLFLEPDAVADLHAVARAVAKTQIPVAVLGKGSNVLVADEGFAGLVVRLGRGFRWSAREGDVVTAGGAMPLPALAGVAQQHGLAGLGFMRVAPGASRLNVFLRAVTFAFTSLVIHVTDGRLASPAQFSRSRPQRRYADDQPDAEFVDELRNKRLGLSDTVYAQIRRYSDAVKRGQRTVRDEAVALAKLIGRRPDAEAVFRAAGRYLANEAYQGISPMTRLIMLSCRRWSRVRSRCDTRDDRRRAISTAACRASARRSCSTFPDPSRSIRRQLDRLRVLRGGTCGAAAYC